MFKKQNRLLFLFGILVIALLFNGALLVEGMRGSSGIRGFSPEETYFNDGTEYAFPFLMEQPITERPIMERRMVRRRI